MMGSKNEILAEAMNSLRTNKIAGWASNSLPRYLRQSIVLYKILWHGQRSRKEPADAAATDFPTR